MRIISSAKNGLMISALGVTLALLPAVVVLLGALYGAASPEGRLMFKLTVGIALLGDALWMFGLYVAARNMRVIGVASGGTVFVRRIIAVVMALTALFVYTPVIEPFDNLTIFIIEALGTVFIHVIMILGLDELGDVLNSAVVAKWGNIILALSGAAIVTCALLANNSVAAFMSPIFSDILDGCYITVYFGVAGVVIGWWMMAFEATDRHLIANWRETADEMTSSGAYVSNR